MPKPPRIDVTPPANEAVTAPPLVEQVSAMDLNDVNQELFEIRMELAGYQVQAKQVMAEYAKMSYQYSSKLAALKKAVRRERRRAKDRDAALSDALALLNRRLEKPTDDPFYYELSQLLTYSPASKTYHKQILRLGSEVVRLEELPLDSAHV